MFSRTIRVSFRLIVAFVLFFGNAHARHVGPAAYGYSVRTSETDLAVSASAQNPVIAQLVRRPHAYASVRSDKPVSAPSERVEKILRRPVAFSYNTDQVHQATSQVASSPRKKVRGQARFDQQPDAVDYYKYIERIENQEKNAVASTQKDNKSGGDINTGADTKESVQVKDRPETSKSSNYQYASSYSSEHSSKDKTGEASKIKPIGFHKDDGNKHENEDVSSLASRHSKEVDDLLSHDDERPANLITQPSEDSEVKQDYHEDSSSDNSGEAIQDSKESGSRNEEEHQEKVADGETSASSHGEGKSHGGNYKKGGGKEHEEEHHGTHKTDAKKVYDGKHEHKDEDKGHHDDKGYDIHYLENGGHKDGEHEDDGYHAEHEHGEEGKRGTHFQEDGEHSKGHSTQGEHNVHKKDEYEKKQEFYDESHEGGDHEKDGKYFHEDDYAKGGHQHSEHKKGEDHKDHYGKDKKHEHGGHHHEDKGHDDSDGHDKHHEKHEKGGKQHDKHAEKKQHYEKSSSKGDKGKGDSEGHGTRIEETQSVVVAAPDAEVQGSHQEKSAAVADNNHGSESKIQQQTADRSTSHLEDATKPQKGDKGEKGDVEAAASRTDADISKKSYNSANENKAHASKKDTQQQSESKVHPAVRPRSDATGREDQSAKESGPGGRKVRGNNRYMLVIVDDHNNQKDKLSANEGT